MNILYISQYFPPEIGATQTRAYEMCKNLIRLGHNVTVLTEIPNHPSGIVPDKYRGKYFLKEIYDGIPVIRAWVYATPVKTMRTRMAFYLSFFFSAILRSLFERSEKIDLVYATSPPLFVGPTGLFISTLLRAKFVFEVRDLWPESAIELDQISHPLQIQAGHWMADICYRHAERIVCVTDGIWERLSQKKIDLKKVLIIKNGTNLDKYKFSFDRSLQQRLGWKDKFVILYAGIHGIAQGLDTVLEAAGMVAEKDHVHFVFIGEGPVKTRLIERSRNRGLKNVEFLGEVPSEKIARYISLADICLVPLKKKDLFLGALPSKMFDSWACSKPVMLSVDGEARKILDQSCGGVFVEPENPARLAEAVLNLSCNRKTCHKMGQMGNRFVQSNGFVRSRQAEILSTALNHIGTRNPDPGSGKFDPEAIKVVRIISRLNIGGPAIHVEQLTGGMDPKRFKTVLITGKISVHEGDMEYLFQNKKNRPVVVPELQREINFFKDLVAFFKILRMLIEERPQVLHTHAAKAGVARLAAWVYGRISRCDIKVVHTFHGNVFRGYFGRLKSSVFISIERGLSRITDAIIAISDSQKEELAQTYKVATDNRIRKIELGFDLSPFFSCGGEKGRFRETEGFSPEEILIGIVGRLVPIKNHRIFLESARILSSRMHALPIRFVIVGDGELRSALESSCMAAGLKNTVLFTGWRKDVAGIYADLDILALTSMNEGTPVSIIEAMASSVPVVSTNAGGVKDLLGPATEKAASHGNRACERGILCDRHDPVSFAHALEKQIRTADSEKFQRLNAARAFVAQRYSKERLIRDVERLYQELVHSGNRPECQ